MKQDLTAWVELLRQERLIEKAMVSLERAGYLTGSARMSARGQADSGAGVLLGKLQEMERTSEGRNQLNKLRNLVRQWRAEKKRKREGAVTRKVFLSREADQVLRGMVGPSGTNLTISGLVDYLLKREGMLFREERDLLSRERAEMRAEIAKKDAALKRREFKLAQTAERISVREEEVESWRKLRGLALKAAQKMAIGSVQEVTIRLETGEDGKQSLDVRAVSGSQRQQGEVRRHVAGFLAQLSKLIEK
jgi:hypothetical protein|eukprot:gnl/MRDRNA2_/MRDRNA2_18501_c0_seq1.p1 gnl/MRDRNA2_/MRDRNA2_18501_c0~~gnl/MRDRNA2_/MRDRNA2_18501_c0_seq1.p1  ORF type:complete len:249 (+),score=42.50 gnl/MRDRNA2_/MRDRNA2_18501_c0_seq1:244-990(+)